MTTFKALLFPLLLFPLTLGGCKDSQLSKVPAPQPKAEVVEIRKQRTLDVEPQYENEPRYGLLVAGVDAKEKFWIVLDGQTVYLDRNSNGDLTDADEKIVAGDVKGGSSEVTQIGLGELAGKRLELTTNADEIATQILVDEAEQDAADSKLEGWQLAALQRIDNQDKRKFALWLGPDKERAVVTHIKGPLQFGLVTKFTKLSRKEPTKFDVKIGVSELLNPDTGSKAFPVLLTRDVPGDLAPVAEFTFTHKDPTQPPIKQRLWLDQRC